MSEIKWLENYKRLKEMIIKGEKGNAEYFANKLGVSRSSFFRLLKYVEEIDKMNIQYNKHGQYYYVN